MECCPGFRLATGESRPRRAGMTGSRRSFARVGRVPAVHAVFATLPASAPRREGDAGQDTAEPDRRRSPRRGPEPHDGWPADFTTTPASRRKKLANAWTRARTAPFLRAFCLDLMAA